MLLCRYADALAGQDGFSQSESQVRLVIRVLKTYQRCADSADSSVSRNQAAMAPMIARLESYIRKPAPTDAAPPVEKAGEEL